MEWGVSFFNIHFEKRFNFLIMKAGCRYSWHIFFRIYATYVWIKQVVNGYRLKSISLPCREGIVIYQTFSTQILKVNDIYSFKSTTNPWSIIFLSCSRYKHYSCCLFHPPSSPTISVLLPFEGGRGGDLLPVVFTDISKDLARSHSQSNNKKNKKVRIQTRVSASIDGYLQVLHPGYCLGN